MSIFKINGIHYIKIVYRRIVAFFLKFGFEIIALFYLAINGCQLQYLNNLLHYIYSFLEVFICNIIL